MNVRSIGLPDIKLSGDVLNQVMKQQYCKLLASVSEEDVFDAVVKAVDFEPINQEYVSTITCFDSSLVYLTSIPTNHTMKIQINSRIRCEPVSMGSFCSCIVFFSFTETTMLKILQFSVSKGNYSIHRSIFLFSDSF